MEIQQGRFNDIHPSVQFLPFKGGEAGPVILGDCNTIHEGTRVLVGPEGFRMGDWNMIHNHTTIGGPGRFEMGHNCWFGQEVWLDSTGGLSLGNGVRIGLRSHVWSHMASGEQIEGWPVVFRPTRLNDDVWLIGDDVHVASGVTMGARSAVLAHSTVTSNTEPDKVYAGTPAKETPFKLRREITLNEKFKLMRDWADIFLRTQTLFGNLVLSGGDTYFTLTADDYTLFVVASLVPARLNSNIKYNARTITTFDLKNKTYTKRLTPLEREFCVFLWPNKARFVPVEDGK